MIGFERNGWRCKWYADTSVLVMTRGESFDRAFDPTARRYDLNLEQHTALEKMLDSQCDCVLPEHSCPDCRRAARELYGDDIPY